MLRIIRNLASLMPKKMEGASLDFFPLTLRGRWLDNGDGEFMLTMPAPFSGRDYFIEEDGDGEDSSG